MDRAKGAAMSIFGKRRPKHPLEPVVTPIRLGRSVAYTPEDDPQDGKVPGTSGFELERARLLLEENRAFAPHCDQRILHAPGDCWACDLYPDWQKLRELWGIAFTGHQPKDEVLRVDQHEEPVAVRRMLPCPADYNRPPDSPSDHRQWGPNTAQGERP